MKNLPRIEFKHIIGVGLMYMAYHAFDIAMLGHFGKDNAQFISPIIELFKALLYLIAGYLWGNAIGSAKKTDALIDLSKQQQAPTITNITPTQTTTIAPADVAPELKSTIPADPTPLPTPPEKKETPTDTK